MSEDMVPLVYLVKGRAIQLNIIGLGHRTFAPSNNVTAAKAVELLKKQITIGGCCGKPERTMHLFATPEQLESGERKWIE
jgi:hypothetical protein